MAVEKKPVTSDTVGAGTQPKPAWSPSRDHKFALPPKPPKYGPKKK